MFLKKSDPYLLIVGMTGVKMGDRFVQIGCALLREPDLLQAMQKDAHHEALCIHCNKCMPTIYSGTRCVLIEGTRPSSDAS